MNPTAAKELLLTTDYPLDKILETFSGSFTALARYAVFQPRATESTIPHSIGDWGLINGVYSLNGTVWYPFGTVVADTSGSMPTFQNIEVSAFCTSSNVVIRASNYTASAATIYYALQVLSRD